MFVVLPLIIVMGNGLWWWWHRQFVTTIRQLQSDKPSIGISNMGLGATRYYVLPEFRRTVWQKMPEMFLWVLVNTLFLEAAIPRVSGIFYNLVLSLSDGERSVEWNGVMVAVSFIGLTWLIVRLISDYRLIRPVSYSGWGFIQGDLIGHVKVHGWLRHEQLIQVLASVPLIFVFVIFFKNRFFSRQKFLPKNLKICQKFLPKIQNSCQKNVIVLKINYFSLGPDLS